MCCDVLGGNVWVWDGDAYVFALWQWPGCMPTRGAASLTTPRCGPTMHVSSPRLRARTSRRSGAPAGLLMCDAIP